MTNPRNIEVRRFFQAGLQRLGDAEVLFDNGHTTGAVYVGGYAVECTLKALLLARSPASRHASIVQSFRGKSGHSFDWLKKELLRRGVGIPAELTRSFVQVNTWSTDLRYQAGRTRLHDAIMFLEAVRQVVNFIKARI